MKFKSAILIIPLLLLLISPSVESAEPVLKIETYLSTNGVYAGGEFLAAILIKLKDNWHINSAKPLDVFAIPTEVRIKQSDNIAIRDIKFPSHKLKKFLFSDDSIAVYEDTLLIYISSTVSKKTRNKTILMGSLFYQACNDKSCLTPEETSFLLEIPILNSSELIAPQNNKFFGPKNTGLSEDSYSTDFNFKDSFSQKGILLTFILIFLGGLALNLTPCVYPLIPVTISYFGGQTGEHGGKRIIAVVLFVIGIAITNSTLGTIAALTGGLLGTFMTNPIVIIAIALILVALSLSMFGVYEFGIPSFLMQMAGGSRAGYFGAIFMGLSMGIVAAPCIGPFVIGLLTYVASKGDPFLGFTMFFTLSLGLGLPFLFLAFFSSKIESLPRSGEWMIGVRIIFGLVLFGMALYFIHPLIPESIYAIIFPVYVIGNGVYLILFNKSGESAKVFVFIKRLIAIVALLVGVWLLKPDAKNYLEMSWQLYSEKAFYHAKENFKPVIIDFHADWCIPCKELDRFTFTSPQVVEKSKRFVLLKADLTPGGTPEVLELGNRFGIKGVPTIVFLDKNGEEINSIRLVGFEKVPEFLKRMDIALSKASG